MNEMSAYLCKNLRLDIQREETQVRVTLRNDLDFTEVEICYEITRREDGTQRRYYLKEAMVIAMRRLVDAGIEHGLISDFPGASTTSKSGTTKAVDPPITFSTEEDSL